MRLQNEIRENNKKRGCLPNAEDVTRSVVRGTKKKKTTDTNTNRHVKKLCIETGEITLTK